MYHGRYERPGNRPRPSPAYLADLDEISLQASMMMEEAVSTINHPDAAYLIRKAQGMLNYLDGAYAQLGPAWRAEFRHIRSSSEDDIMYWAEEIGIDLELPMRNVRPNMGRGLGAPTLVPRASAFPNRAAGRALPPLQDPDLEDVIDSDFDDEENFAGNQWEDDFNEEGAGVEGIGGEGEQVDFEQFEWDLERELAGIPDEPVREAVHVHATGNQPAAPQVPVDAPKEEWTLQTGPGRDPLPPLNTAVSQPLRLLDSDDFLAHEFFLTDFNPEPSAKRREESADVAAQRRRIQKGGALDKVFEANMASNNPKLKQLTEYTSARGQIWATETDRDDLYEVVRAISVYGNRDHSLVCWRLLGVGTGISQGKLYLLRSEPGDDGNEEAIARQLLDYSSGKWAPVDIDEKQAEELEKRFAGAQADEHRAGPSTQRRSRMSQSDFKDPTADMNDEQKKNYKEMIAAQQAKDMK